MKPTLNIHTGAFLKTMMKPKSGNSASQLTTSKKLGVSLSKSQKRGFNTFNFVRNNEAQSSRAVNPESRSNLLDSIIKSSPQRIDALWNPSKEFISTFADDVLTADVLRNLLPSSTWKALQKAIEDPHHDIDIQTADQVANAMKDWALSKGATHFTHWFHPLTGATSEKHDSFLTYSRKDGKFIVDFSGKELIKGEPDASSFPSGGVRVTSQARGYTIWDMTSPPFIKKGANGASLYVPSAFCSWTGEALDTKTPLLRSEEAISREFSSLVNLVGGFEEKVNRVWTSTGVEQEFFLIDRGFYLSRPDLVTVGRTLVGAPPTKGQESEHHYFGVIDQRVLACLQDLEKELWKLGIPVKSRHNEVAPSQFEFAPIFENSVIAADHNLLAMEVLKEVAARHNLACLLCEKPFNYVNGSGKHLNWSLDTDTKENLLDPGNNPHDNLNFLVTLAVVIRGIHVSGDLLRAAIAVPGNAHRLGANEAPPPIISAYLGDELDSLCQTIMNEEGFVKKNKDVLRLGVGNVPPVTRDSSDRNRTSPFAFTGNKFEFRAVGSSQNVSFPITILNGIMADSARFVRTHLEQKLTNAKSQPEREKVIRHYVAELFKQHYNAVFNGNGYSEEWVKEATKRGLSILRTAPQALAVFDRKESRQIFESLDILSSTELGARSAIFHEHYFEHLMTEGRLLVDMVTTRILPAAATYLERLTTTYANTLSILKDEKLLAHQKKTIAGLSGTIEEITANVERLTKIMHDAHEAVGASDGDFRRVLSDYADLLTESMPKVRACADHLETTVDNSLWPLPKYDDIFLTSK